MQEYFEILLLYPNWIKFIIVGLFVSLLIQLFYYLHYYNGIIRYNRKIKKNLIGYTTSKPPVSAPTDATESTQDTTDVAQPDDQNNNQDFPWWGYVVIAVGGIAVGIGIAFVFVKLKKKG